MGRRGRAIQVNKCWLRKQEITILQCRVPGVGTLRYPLRPSPARRIHPDKKRRDPATRDATRGYHLKQAQWACHFPAFTTEVAFATSDAMKFLKLSSGAGSR